MNPIVRAVTRNGRTHYVEEQPKPVPLTPDEMILRAVGVATAIAVAGALVWSTVSVGAMLATFAATWAAYMIAGIFDLTWIVSMATEYVLRFEPNRQKVPKRIGWLSLLISMGAIFTHGVMLGLPWIGAFGAIVSALAKGLWWLLMYATTRRLDKDTQAWLSAELGEVHAMRAEQMAIAKVERERERYGLNQPSEPVSQPEFTAVRAPEQPANQIENQPEPPPVQPVQSTVNRTGPPQVEDQVDVLVSMLREGEHVTKKSAAHVLGIPESTAWRRLTKAQSIVNQYN